MNVPLLPLSDCVNPAALGPPGPIVTGVQADDAFSALLTLLLGTPSPAGELPAPLEVDATVDGGTEEPNRQDESVAPVPPALTPFVTVNPSPTRTEAAQWVGPPRARPPVGPAPAQVVAALTTPFGESSAMSAPPRPAEGAPAPQPAPPTGPQTVSLTPVPVPEGSAKPALAQPIAPPAQTPPSGSPPSPTSGGTVEFSPDPARPPSEAAGVEAAPRPAAPAPAALGPEVASQPGTGFTRRDGVLAPAMAPSASDATALAGSAGAPEQPQGSPRAPLTSGAPTPLASASQPAPTDGATAAAEASALPQPATEPVTVDGFADRIVTHVRMAAGDGSGQVEIQLHPQHLGRVSLMVSVQGHEVSLTLTTDNAAAQQLLSARLPDLALALSGAGMSLSQVNVSVDDRDRGQQGSPARSGSGHSSQPQPSSVEAPIGGWRVPSLHVLDVSA